MESIVAFVWVGFVVGYRPAAHMLHSFPLISLNQFQFIPALFSLIKKETSKRFHQINNKSTQFMNAALMLYFDLFFLIFNLLYLFLSVCGKQWSKELCLGRPFNWFHQINGQWVICLQLGPSLFALFAFLL